MCNPRRIRIRATRMLNEAWRREVSRIVELREQVAGEARVRQPLGVTLGGPTLQALESVLADENSGWTETDQGYRFQVEGGYVTYLVDEQALEIVAVRTGEVQAAARAARNLEGRLETEISAEGEGKYYEDGYFGQTREFGEKKAREDAEKKLDQAAREKIDTIGREAESRAGDAVEAEARKKAGERLRREAAKHEAALAEQAREHLNTVGVRARQAFNQVLALAYRDAVMAYARAQGAGNIHCDESGDTVDIEFTFAA